MWQSTLNSQLLQGQNRRSMLHLPGIYMQALRIRSGQRKQNFTDKTTCNFRLKTQHEESLLLSQKPFSGLTEEYTKFVHMLKHFEVSNCCEAQIWTKGWYSKWHRIEVLPFAMAILHPEGSQATSRVLQNARRRAKWEIPSRPLRGGRNQKNHVIHVIQWFSMMLHFFRKKNTNQLSNSIQFIWHAWKKSKKNLTSSPVKKTFQTFGLEILLCPWEKSASSVVSQDNLHQKTPTDSGDQLHWRSTNFGLDPSRTLEVPLTSASTLFKRFTCRFGANVDVDFFSLFSTNPPF